MKQTVLSREEELLEKYYAFYERKVRAGTISPLSGLERITLEIMMGWLCERYNVISKQMRKMRES